VKRWSWESTMACFCTVLVIWIGQAATSRNLSREVAVALSTCVGFGVGFGLSGVRHNRAPGREVSWFCLCVCLVYFLSLICARILVYSRYM